MRILNRSFPSQAALKDKKPQISSPNMSLLKNLIVVISSPIINEEGEYFGFIGGTIYLKNFNILSKILGEHYYENGSYIYVIDENKNVLYHPYVERIGTQAGNNSGIDEMLSKKEGGMVLTNSYGVEMLAGYSTIPSTGWIIVTQSPVESSLVPLTGIMQKVIIRTLPMAFIVFIFIWFFARAISRPLQQLADKAKLLNSPTVGKEISGIRSWYVESIKLQKALLTSVKLIQDQIMDLRKDAETDPLTGASNRRALKLKLGQLSLLETPFSILALDIDHFKHVNDTFGHPVGDEVLKRTTYVINTFCREHDLVSRTGGEEFVLLLTNTTTDDSLLIAERLRLAIANTKFKTVGHITVSIGVASWKKETTATYEETLSVADEALYEAKGNGRNQCVYKE
ncbi:diguanylate cyclase [Marinomonas sp. A79]|uniref:diguanylate cyclase n=2 Tax=Marinomonas vulgaris TaxID=2823372 RepID=A0ABS5HBS0_9GAMM|nr:diguanylate cyclase [Marinomonas vulgaris]